MRRDPAQRRTSWTELFFDLVFVVAIGNLTGVLEDTVSWRAVFAFGLLFVPTWWAWLSFSFYADVFEADTWPYLAGMLGGMGGALLLAAGIPAAANGHPELFILAYLGMRALVVALWQWARLRVGEAREMASRYVVGFTLAAALWAASLLVPAAARPTLWVLGMLTDLLTPVAGYLWVRSAPVHVSHLPERLGLFTLIVLGEAVVAVASRTGDLRGTDVVTALSAFGLACALFLLYFRHVNEEYVERVVAGERDALRASFAWSYGHLVIFAGITAASAAIHHALASGMSHHWSQSSAWLLTLALAVTLLALRGVQRLTAGPRSGETGPAWWLAAFLLLLLGASGAHAPPVVLGAFLLIATLGVAEFRAHQA